VCEPIFEKPLKEISFGQILVQLFRTAGRFDMEVQPSLVLLQKTLLNIEGLGRQLYPELDLWQTALPYLETWNAKRLNPFTLMRKFQENLPDWVDQLPMLPIMLFNAVGQAEELGKLNKNLQAAEAHRRLMRHKRVKRARTLGIVLLLLAGGTLLPPVAAALDTLPVLTLGLAGLAAYLLSFRN
jgi:ubiquinone biosynthesis protein